MGPCPYCGARGDQLCKATCDGGVKEQPKEIDPVHLELIRDDIKVELEYIGEGWDGDYDPSDPEDEPLLRFTVLIKSDDTHLDYDWVQIDDASYCTRLPATLSEAKQRRVLELLMNEVYDPATSGASIKKLCERLSWVGPDWLEGRDAVQTPEN